MIPKVIHYCWFGKNQLGSLEQRCIDSWTQHMPTYEIRCWNENSFDLSTFPFAAKAFSLGKFAFVSDVARLYVLHKEGGIYLDTDVLVLKSFDEFLHLPFFTGMYKPNALNAAVIGSGIGSPVLREMLDFYITIQFEYLRPITIPEVFDQFLWNKNKDEVRLFSPEFFYPLTIENKEDDYQKHIVYNSYAVHLWNHSWKDEFMLLKENSFLKSMILNLQHCWCYPSVYLTFTHQSQYFKAFYSRLKTCVYHLIYG